MRKRWLGWIAALCVASSARAEPLRIDASAERMRVDGALREWRGAHFTELGSGDDARLRYALASADEGLYLGVEIADERLITGERGDALVLTLALPEGTRGAAVSELWLAPGESGRSKARAWLRSGTGPKQLEPRVQVVEGPRSQGAGYVLEAYVPWAALRGGDSWAEGRGSLRLIDVDREGAAETTLASASAKRPEELPALALGAGQNDPLGSFLRAKQLSGIAPRYDFRADVAGDARPERVVIVDRYVVVYGAGYKQGEGYGYFALPYGLGGGLKSASVLDLTGDGRAELVATVRQQNELGSRELWLVLALDEDGIAPRFSVELKKELAGGFVENALRVLPLASKQRAPTIEVKAARAQGVDASSYREASISDAQPILLPWGEIESRRYAFDGARFALIAEQRRTAVQAQNSSAPVQAPAQAHAEAPATPSSAEVLALFKRQQQLPPGAKPVRTVRANVLGGAAAEQVDLFDGVLVLTGPEVGEGRGYLTYALPVNDARDVLELRAAEVTGTSPSELLVRTRQPLTGAAGTERELLWVLRGEPGGRIGRALLVEVARRQGASAIENRVKVEGGALAIEPGVAKGWSKQSYPFAPEGAGGVERLLLPWSDRPVRYDCAGGVLVCAR